MGGTALFNISILHEPIQREHFNDIRGLLGRIFMPFDGPEIPPTELRTQNFGRKKIFREM